LVAVRRGGDVFITKTNETTESLLSRYREASKNPKCAAKILSITWALCLHCL
jgi:hypothetical protein